MRADPARSCWGIDDPVAVVNGVCERKHPIRIVVGEPTEVHISSCARPSVSGAVELKEDRIVAVDAARQERKAPRCSARDIAPLRHALYVRHFLGGWGEVLGCNGAGGKENEEGSGDD